MLIIDLIRHVKVDGVAALYGKTDVAPLLNENKLLIKKLIKKPSYDLIISSPLQRCSLLAKDLAQKTSKPLIYNKALQEINFGLYDGIDFDLIPLTATPVNEANLDLSKLSNNRLSWLVLERYFKSPSEVNLPHAESLIDFHKRISTTWIDLITLEYQSLCCHNQRGNLPLALSFRQIQSEQLSSPVLSFPLLPKPKPKSKHKPKPKRIAIVTHGGVIRMILAEILGVDWRKPEWHQNLQVTHGSVSTIAITQPFDNKSLLQQVRNIAMPLPD